MSLDWDRSQIKDWETVTRNEDKSMKPETHFLIFATMAVDIGQITEKNYKDFYLRCKFFYSLFYPEDVPNIPTIEMVKAHIGLRTNVITKSFAHFKSRQIEGFVRENMYQLRDK